jgi:hypothetical protein
MNSEDVHKKVREAIGMIDVDIDVALEMLMTVRRMLLTV